MVQSLDHFEIDEIEVFVDITPSTFNMLTLGEDYPTFSLNKPYWLLSSASIL